MKVNIKPLKGESFEVECDTEMKVEALKAKVGELKAEFPAADQKLIYAGKILTDESFLKDYNIKEGDNIVVMVAKAKPKAAAAPAEAAAAAPAAQAAPAPAATPAATAPAPTATPPAAAGAVPPALAELRNNPRFGELAQVIASNPQSLNLMLPALAQTHPAIEQAIKDNLQVFMRMIGEAAGAGGGMMADDPMGGDDLEGLASDPQMAAFAQMIAQNPAALQQILPAIEQSDPNMARMIRENPQAFLQMLQAAGGGAGGGALPGAGGGGGGPQVVRLTEEEGAAVQRLQDMLGVDRNVAAQAYLACGKNEEAAANFILEGNMMD